MRYFINKRIVSSIDKQDSLCYDYDTGGENNER